MGYFKYFAVQASNTNKRCYSWLQDGQMKELAVRVPERNIPNGLGNTRIWPKA